MTMPWMALSFERTLWSAALDMLANGTLFEPPNWSQWISWASENSNGPPFQRTAPDHTCGLRVAVSVSSVEYCSDPSKPANTGDSYCTALTRRSWKREALLVPKPGLRSMLLVDTKLPLETPRNE